MWTPEGRERVGNYGCGRALSDFQWATIAPLIPPEKPGGRHREVDVRGVLDAILYVTRTGCQWRHLPPPPHFPPVGTVYGYYRRFIDEGVWDAIRHHLVMEVREQEDREASPTAAIIDSQSVKTTEKGGRAATTPARRSTGASAMSPSTRSDFSWRSPSIRPTSRTATGRSSSWPS
jgi:putative transposase